MFKTTMNKGFYITLKNGITISTQFGAGNYCDNYNDDIKKVINHENHQCKDAEIAIWDENERWITRKVFAFLGEEIGDDVAGRIEIDRWIEILNACNSFYEHHL